METPARKLIRHDVLELSRFCQGSPRYPATAGIWWRPDLGCWIATDARIFILLPEEPSAAADMPHRLWLDAVLCRGVRALAREGDDVQIALSEDRKGLELHREEEGFVQPLPGPRTEDGEPRRTPDVPKLPIFGAQDGGRQRIALGIDQLEALIRFARAARVDQLILFVGARDDEPLGVAFDSGAYQTAAFGAVCPRVSASTRNQKTPGQRLAEHVKEIEARRTMAHTEEHAADRGGGEGPTRDGAAAVQ